MLNRCIRLSVIVGATVLTAGCALNATMVPVSGPLSELKPVPVVKVRADGILGNSGKITLVLPPDDPCEGRWASAAGQDVTVAAGSLISQYGSSYLSGYSVSTGKGQNPGR